MLSNDAREVLRELVGRLGQVVPDDMSTFPSYGDVHEALGLQQAGETIGQSLQNQGLESLGRWAMDEGLPAIDAIVVDSNSLLPGKGFYRLHDRRADDFQWLIKQAAEAKAYAWAPILGEEERGTLTLQNAMTLLSWLRMRAATNAGIITPFTTQEAMAVLGRDDLQRFARAQGNVQSLIDFACYRCGLPPLGLTSSTPFEEAWISGNRPWSYPVPQMQQAAQARQWSEADFHSIRATIRELPGLGRQLWMTAHAQEEEEVHGWAHSFGDTGMVPELYEVRDFEQCLQELLGKPKRKGGIAPAFTASQRKAIETRAMVVAREALEREGWLVEDTSLGHPFDFRAHRAGIEMHVEVKGTTTSGERIVLTRGEVRHHLETQAESALFVVSGIELAGTTEAPLVSGGLLRSWVPWSIDNANLTPLAYEYSVPNFTPHP